MGDGDPYIVLLSYIWLQPMKPFSDIVLFYKQLLYIHTKKNWLKITSTREVIIS